MTDEIMSRDEVAAHRGIDPETVRSWARRHGVRYGYLRADVEAVPAASQGRRTDLEKKPVELIAEAFTELRAQISAALPQQPKDTT